ncbi:hypothetical protein HYH02_014406 [Chlamydomonas schloesseri]|uniref:Protein kinase domain-containing protein n=1 Tax=Chlamydomonas schloesseri TaxID=2026947 RepID=A0A835SXM4_9CHLO|nr:hypothetical protein HYH02_014406 [Chlamydomonas schloesseri]|eukprot:KAG2428390.1 hypothetical protein HYH02_014406 [Chlamydomonas schloesseri]
MPPAASSVRGVAFDSPLVATQSQPHSAGGSASRSNGAAANNGRGTDTEQPAAAAAEGPTAGAVGPGIGAAASGAEVTARSSGKIQPIEARPDKAAGMALQPAARDSGTSEAAPPPAAAAAPVSGDGSSTGGGDAGVGALPPPAGSGSRPGRQNVQASRYRELDAREVAECAPHEILRGISLSQQRLGRGSFGIVMSGAYHGLRCAVKIIVADDLDKSALRELLLAPSINHANLVQTYTSRCARLTHEFFDLLEGGGGMGADGVAVPAAGGSTSTPETRDLRRPRALLPIPLQSGDGFGDPGCGIATALDPYRILHLVLHEFIAKTEQYMLVIVQELCTKGTLHAAIRQGIFRPSDANPQWNVRLARRALLRTAMELARGLLHLHDTGVVHGDLKPQNVLLATSRDDRRGFSAKIADFGLVHVLPQHANSVTTDSFGSPAYMAPEAFSGKASKATDVWSFGVCLWELLVGRVPYSDAAGVRDLVADLAAGRAPGLVWPDGAEMADGIIALGRRCISHRPEDRPDFREVVQELVQIERIIRAELLAPEILARAVASSAAGAAAAAAAVGQQLHQGQQQQQQGRGQGQGQQRGAPAAGAPPPRR